MKDNGWCLSTSQKCTQRNEINANNSGIECLRKQIHVLKEMKKNAMKSKNIENTRKHYLTQNHSKTKEAI